LSSTANSRARTTPTTKSRLQVPRCRDRHAQKAGASAANGCDLCPHATSSGPWSWWASPNRNCPSRGSCRPPMSVLGRSNAPSFAERRIIHLAVQAPRPPSSLARPRLPHRASKNSLSHASPKCARLWFPGKGTRNMAPQVPGLFYSCKLQSKLDWWKMPHHFASKKVLRWVEYGVKVEFKKGLPFAPKPSAPKPSAPKFVDPQDVDFAIQDLLKGRRIGVYQDLAPGGEQFLSRSRVHTPPDERHVRCSSKSPPPRHAHAVVCRRLVDRLLLLRGSFKGATNIRGRAPRRGHSPRAAQGMLRYSDPDLARPFGIQHLLHWQRSPTGSRKEVLCVVSPSARAALRGSQQSSSRRLRPPSPFLRGNHLVLASGPAGFLSSPRMSRLSVAGKLALLGNTGKILN
jgi:hypothetical protein